MDAASHQPGVQEQQQRQQQQKALLEAVAEAHVRLRRLLQSELDFAAVAPHVCQRLLDVDEGLGGGGNGGKKKKNKTKNKNRKRKNADDDDGSSSDQEGNAESETENAEEEQKHRVAVVARWWEDVAAVGSSVSRSAPSQLRFMRRLRSSARNVVVAEMQLASLQEAQLQEHGSGQQASTRQSASRQVAAEQSSLPFWIQGGFLDLRPLVLWLIHILSTQREAAEQRAAKRTAASGRVGGASTDDDEDGEDEDEEDELDDDDIELIAAGGDDDERQTGDSSIADSTSESLLVNTAVAYMTLLQINGAIGAAGLFHPHALRTVLGLLNTWSARAMHGVATAATNSSAKRTDEIVVDRDALLLCAQLCRLVPALSAAPHTLSDAVECLCQVTRSAQVRATVHTHTKKCKKSGSSTFICEYAHSDTRLPVQVLTQAWRALAVLARRDESGDESRHMDIVARKLMPTLMMNFTHDNPEAANVVADRTVAFLLTHAGNSTLIALGQQLMLFAGIGSPNNGNSAPNAQQQRQIVAHAVALLSRKSSDKVLSAADRINSATNFLVRATRHSDNRVRCVAVDVASRLAVEVVSLDDDHAELSRCVLFSDGCVGRVADKSSNVRVRALAACSFVLGELQEKSSAVFDEQVVSALLSVLFPRLLDEKGSVRAAALKLCQQLMVMPATKNVISAREARLLLTRVCASARHHQISVRKQVCIVATDLLRQTGECSTDVARGFADVDALAQRFPAEHSWLSAIAPLCLDDEPTVASAASRAVFDILFAPLTSSDRDTHAISRSMVLWSLCEHIQDAFVDLYVRAAVRAHSDLAVLTFALPTLEWLLRTTHESESGSVLDSIGCVVAISVILDHTFQETSRGTEYEQLASTLEKEWMHFSIDIREASAITERHSRRLFRAITSVCEHSLKNKGRTEAWSKQMLSRFAAVLCDTVDGSSPVPLDMLQQILRTCGHFHDAIPTPEKLSVASSHGRDWPKLLLLMCEQILCDQIFGSDDDDGAASELPARLSKNTLTCVFVIGELVVLSNEHNSAVQGVRAQRAKFPKLKMAHKTSTCIQSLMDASGPLAHRFGEVPEFKEVRSMSFLTIGKVSLFDSALARKCVPFIASCIAGPRRDLDSTVRSNAICILGDLCLRSASLCEKHFVHEIAVCAISDPEPSVRLAALQCILSVVGQGFLKLTTHYGQLFQSLCVCLCDVDVRIARICAEGIASLLRSPTSTTQGNALRSNVRTNHEGGSGTHPSNTAFLVAQIVELLFVLNGNTEHPQHTQENVAIAKALAERRMVGYDITHAHHKQVFRFLIRLLSDETCLQLQSLLVAQVLVAFSDEILLVRNALSLEDGIHVHSSKCVLVDCLSILRLPEMNSRSMTVSATEGTYGSETQRARDRLLMQVSFKATTQTIIPTLVEIRRLCTAARSSLQKDVCATIACVCGLQSQGPGEEDVGLANLQLMRSLLCCIVGDEHVIDEIAHDVCSVVRDMTPQNVPGRSEKARLPSNTGISLGRNLDVPMVEQQQQVPATDAAVEDAPAAPESLAFEEVAQASDAGKSEFSFAFDAEQENERSNSTRQSKPKQTSKGLSIGGVRPTKRSKR